jgi:hypothetical protein
MFLLQNLPRNVHPSAWGDPNNMIGACADWTEPSCAGTAKVWFHIHLATLGKVTLCFLMSGGMNIPMHL